VVCVCFGDCLRVCVLEHLNWKSAQVHYHSKVSGQLCFSFKDTLNWFIHESKDFHNVTNYFYLNKLTHPNPFSYNINFEFQISTLKWIVKDHVKLKTGERTEELCHYSKKKKKKKRKKTWRLGSVTIWVCLSHVQCFIHDCISVLVFRCESCRVQEGRLQTETWIWTLSASRDTWQLT